ncbi:MAG: hypothetical protein ACR2FQ_00755 [Pseudonocardiaceae bacterium]
MRPGASAAPGRAPRPAVFLDLNGHRCTLDGSTAVQLVLDVAKDDLDIAEVAARLAIEPG